LLQVRDGSLLVAIAPVVLVIFGKNDLKHVLEQKVFLVGLEHPAPLLEVRRFVARVGRGFPYNCFPESHDGHALLAVILVFEVAEGPFADLDKSLLKVFGESGLELVQIALVLDLIFLSGEQISGANRVLTFSLGKLLLLCLVAFFNIDQRNLLGRPDDLRRCHWTNQLQTLLKLVAHVDAPENSCSRLGVPVSSLKVRLPFKTVLSRRKLRFILLAFFLTDFIRVVDFALDVLFAIPYLGNFALRRLIRSCSDQKCITAVDAIFRF